LSSSCAGDGASSRLDSRILQRRCKRSSGLPRLSVSPVPPPDEAPGFPVTSIFRLGRRWSFELPRLSHPSAVVCEVSGCPVSSLLQFLLRLRLRVAPSPQSSGLPTVSLRVAPNPLLPAWPWAQSPGRPGCCSSCLPRDQSPGFPGFLTLWLRRLMDLRVSPNFASSGGAVSASSGRPDCCVYGCAAPRLRVSPNPASAAGPMMIPRLNSNFASSTLGRG